ncbi:hypothetical protein Pa4123_81870 [Phytohabitans aurantiacus]|uniref:Uncharacterized protein n=1 Tax=Phytohabitans aurantiacus TaxID=3016789 RepID=A0ABQ5R817_9ACTN|nr:hypothetical protein Pa4123_81870 [Phytohabitans aurantiacus]
MVLPHAGPHRPTPPGTDRGYLLRWDLRDGSRLAKIAAHDGYVRDVAISTHPPQALLSIGGQDHTPCPFMTSMAAVHRRRSRIPGTWAAVAGPSLDGQRRAVPVDEDGRRRDRQTRGLRAAGPGLSNARAYRCAPRR